MTPITRQDILAHQTIVPWSAQYQVEQDLLLCRAMVALFDDDFLSSQIAMRGGTLLHKVHLAPASRYSEDIDLVLVGNRPEEHIRRAIRRVSQPARRTTWRCARDHRELSAILPDTGSRRGLLHQGKHL
jgi:predicted nucleotidyltransferase component of viral defense system